MDGLTHTVNDERSRDALIKSIRDDHDKHGYSVYSVKHGVSKAQFNALHVYCGLCAETLNAHGIDVKKLVEAMKEGFSIAHTKDTFKQMVYKPILAALTDKVSTKEQSTVDPQRVQEVISKFFGERFGIKAPDWPSKNKP